MLEKNNATHGTCRKEKQLVKETHGLVDGVGKKEKQKQKNGIRYHPNNANHPTQPTPFFLFIVLVREKMMKEKIRFDSKDARRAR
jgi:hypothetical protein